VVGFAGNTWWFASARSYHGEDRVLTAICAATGIGFDARG
jgi:hypothetical protein